MAATQCLPAGVKAQSAVRLMSVHCINLQVRRGLQTRLDGLDQARNAFQSRPIDRVGRDPVFNRV